MSKSAVWNYETLTAGEKIWWDNLAVAAESDPYVFGKYFLEKDKLQDNIHWPWFRFAVAPFVGHPNKDEFPLCRNDWEDDGKLKVERKSMKEGDPLGPPYRRETRMAYNPRKRQLHELPRGCFKSTFFLEILPTWLGIRDNNISIMLVGRNDKRSILGLNAIDQHISSNPKLIHYWGTDKWRSESDRWTVETKFIGTRTRVRQDPSFWATSLVSLKPGYHPDIVVLDDLLDLDVIKSDELMEKANTFFDLLSPMLTPESVVYVVGTVWSKYDLYDSIEKRKTSNGEAMFDCYIRDAMNPDGTPWWKERMGEEYLHEKYNEAVEGNNAWVFFSQQRMQPITEAEDSLALDKVRWITEAELLKVLPTLRRVGGVDPADEKVGSSGSWAFWAMGTDYNKELWDIEAQKCSAKSDMVDYIVKFVERNRLEVLMIENTVISRRLIPTVEEKLRDKGIKCAVVTVEPHSVNKIRRISEQQYGGIGVAMAQGRLHIRDTNYPFKREVEMFPGGMYTYDLLDIGSYITSWVASNGFYPRKPHETVEGKPLSLDERILQRYHESCDEALKRRDKLAAKPEFRWTRPGVREAVRA